MGAGASPGVAAAAKVATPEELEGVIECFDDEERSRLGSALVKKEKDALFDQVDLNKDGVIDPKEWDLAQKGQLLSGAKPKSPLDQLLDALDREGSGRLDGNEVAEAIDLFNALDKREPLSTSSGDELQKPKIAKDGKVGRRALEALITLFAEGPPERTTEQIAEVFREIYLARQTFLEWAGPREQLDLGPVVEACAVLDKWALRARAGGGGDGRTAAVSPYDGSKYGSELTLRRFTKWLWEALKALEEQFSLPFATSLSRLKYAMSIVNACGDQDWQQLQSVDTTLFGPVLAACDGSEAAETGSRLAKDGDGRLVAADLRRWVREEVIQCSLERIPAAVSRLSEFIPAAVQEEASFRVLRSFRKWDVGGRGSIGRQDLQSVMSKIDIFSQEEMDALICGARPDADGRIDYAEFAKWVLAAP